MICHCARPHVADFEGVPTCLLCNREIVRQRARKHRLKVRKPQAETVPLAKAA